MSTNTMSYEGQERANHVRVLDAAMPPCPKCGQKRYWYNDVPLHGFCWGSQLNPHEEVKIIVPREQNPYL